MVGRLKAANVQWVRLEFMLPPSDLLRSGVGLGPGGISHIDLRHYDRVIDMLCANNIGVLGLLDYQTLERQDWNTKIDNYKGEFVLATKQLAGYFNDRIRYWEVWNEPNYSKHAIDADKYAQLLIATYDAIKDVDINDKILFAGLAQATRQVAGNSRDYFGNVSNALGNLGRQNPAPYDIFALHPYPSDEYKQNDKVVVDPNVYLQWEQPTTINNFFATMTQNGKTNQPIWITEIGWNRAAESTNPVTLGCPAINVTMVTSGQQAFYAWYSFNILFQRTGWNANTPSVTKIFWYQYMDTGASQTICNQTATANVSPSWSTSALVQGAALAQGQQAQVDWWFGLYQGINRTNNNVIDTNPVQCIFSKYPHPESCVRLLYLTLIQGNTVVSGQ